MYDAWVYSAIKGELRLKFVIFLYSFLVFYYALYNVSLVRTSCVILRCVWEKVDPEGNYDIEGNQKKHHLF